MAETTGISWTDATFNPWVGCSKVSPGCAHCYAETLVTGRMGRPGTWGEDGTRERTTPGYWRKPLSWAKTMPAALGRRPRVFCASLADVFEPRPELVPWRLDLFDLIAATPELDWLVLTKRPDVAVEWLKAWYEDPLPNGRFRLDGDENWHWRDGIAYGPSWGVLPNLWIGTSIENSRFTWRADRLREIPARVRFISAEPLLGSLFEPIAEPRIALDGSTLPRRGPLDLTGIDWVIVGGESGGRDARPIHPTWVREIRDAVLTYAAESVGRVAVLPPRPALHFKQWGSWTPDEIGSDPNGVWVSPDGRARTSLAADARDDLPDGSMRMRYAGAQPYSGGKILDGVDWCEFPQYDPVPA